MNEMKQLVSNEQAEVDAGQKCSASYSCDGCEFASGCHESKIYALDLLDSRSTIEKQTEIIKEMRDTLLAISQRNISFVCEDVRQEAYQQWKKTKDYA